MTKHIIIIGAGVAGLSTGCYGQMNGYRTEIFEMHDKPGGLCTAWKRLDYTFDGCIHWLVGTRPDSSFRRLWDELAALQGAEIVNHEEFTRVEAPDGKALSFYGDAGRLEQHLKDLAPEDAGLIEEFTNAIRLFSQLEPPLDPMPPDFDMSQLPPQILEALQAMGRYSQTGSGQWLSQFKNDDLRRLLMAMLVIPDAPIVMAMMALGWQHSRNAGYPIGGSLPFSQAIERRYLDLGGTVHYNSAVEKILVENDRAVGIRLADGTEHRADIVVSAADGYATIFDMLEGRYVNDEVRRPYEEWPIFEPFIQVSLGVNRDLSNEPHSLVMLLPEPVTIAGAPQDRLNIRHFCYDPTIAPPGKSALVSFITSSYDYWAPLAGDRAAYNAEKQAVGRAVLGQLERRFPGITGDVEVVDIATPLTYKRYTGNWQGSYEGWLPTQETMMLSMSGGMSKTLPGLENFYMAGQWVEPGGGLPPAGTSGRGLIRTLCEQDGRSFETSLP